MEYGMINEKFKEIITTYLKLSEASRKECRSELVELKEILNYIEKLINQNRDIELQRNTKKESSAEWDSIAV